MLSWIHKEDRCKNSGSFKFWNPSLRRLYNTSNKNSRSLESQRTRNPWHTKEELSCLSSPSFLIFFLASWRTKDIMICWRIEISLWLLQFLEYAALLCVYIQATAISFFLECFFPLYTPKSGFLGKTSHHRKESFSPELNSRYLDYERNGSAVVRRPLTLGELTLMSWRSCQRIAVQLRKQNPSMVDVHFLLLFHCHSHLKPYLDIRLLIVINN